MISEAQQTTTTGEVEEPPDLETLFKRYQRQVHNLILRKTSSDSKADAISSDVWYKIAVALDENPNYFDLRKGRPITLIYTVLFNALKDDFRKDKIRRLEVEANVRNGDDPRSMGLDNFVGPDKRPDQLMIEQEDLERVERAIEELSETYKDIAHYLIRGIRDNRELVEIFGVPCSTIRSRKYHLRSALRRELQEQGYKGVYSS